MYLSWYRSVAKIYIYIVIVVYYVVLNPLTYNVYICIYMCPIRIRRITKIHARSSTTRYFPLFYLLSEFFNKTESKRVWILLFFLFLSSRKIFSVIQAVDYVTISHCSFYISNSNFHFFHCELYVPHSTFHISLYTFWIPLSTFTFPHSSSLHFYSILTSLSLHFHFIFTSPLTSQPL